MKREELNGLPDTGGISRFYFFELTTNVNIMQFNAAIYSLKNVT